MRLKLHQRSTAEYNGDETTPTTSTVYHPATHASWRQLQISCCASSYLQRHLHTFSLKLFLIGEFFPPYFPYFCAILSLPGFAIFFYRST